MIVKIIYLFELVSFIVTDNISVAYDLVAALLLLFLYFVCNIIMHLSLAI